MNSPAREAPHRRTLVMRPGALGDFVITLPLLAKLRAQHIEGHMTLMTAASFAELIEGQGFVDAARPIDAAETTALFMPAGTAPARAREFFSQFDLAVSLWCDPDGAVADALGRYVPRVVALDPLPDAESQDHIADQLLDRAVAAGLLDGCGPVDRRLPRLRLSDDARARAGRRLAGAASPRVAIHPGSGGTAKNWPAALFAEVARNLHRLGASVVLLEGPADVEAADSLRRATGDVVPAASTGRASQRKSAARLCPCWPRGWRRARCSSATTAACRIWRRWPQRRR